MKVSNSLGRSWPGALSLVLLALSSCGHADTSTPFVPPTAVPPSLPATVPTSVSTPTVLPTRIELTPSAIPPCSDGLTYIRDLTVPDGTSFTSGQSIDKQWLVTNSGSCNWDARYHLKLISGDAMGASTEQALYPARAGSQLTLRIVFTAPSTVGDYRSAWQALDPAGQPFGEPVYIQITVQ